MESPTWWESFLTPSGANSSSELYNTHYQADDAWLQKILTNKIRPIRTIFAACMVTYLVSLSYQVNLAVQFLNTFSANVFFQIKPFLVSEATQ